MAHNGSSPATTARAAYRRIADARACMSAYRRKTDLTPSRCECVLMTQCVNREFFGLDRFGLVSRSYLDLETTRNQTLPMRLPICGYRAKAALPRPRTLAARMT